MMFIALTIIICSLFALALGATVGYYLGGQDQQLRDVAELELLRTQVDAFEHERHLGKMW